MQEIQNGENSQNFYLLHLNFVSILLYKIQLVFSKRIPNLNFHLLLLLLLREGAKSNENKINVNALFLSADFGLFFFSLQDIPEMPERKMTDQINEVQELRFLNTTF